MNIAYALDYIPRRMRAIGVHDNYITQYRHLFIASKSTKKINAGNHLMLLIAPEAQVKIRSKRGVYDLNDFSIVEQQHEHSGTITINNPNDAHQFVLFIEVIPLNAKKLDP